MNNERISQVIYLSLPLMNFALKPKINYVLFSIGRSYHLVQNDLIQLDFTEVIVT
jgi:hypothetical protein